MSRTLIIAEKPSVAADLARVLGRKLGKFTRDEASGSYSNEAMIITSAVGHLVEQKKPQTEDGKSLPWKMDYLPVMPKTMELEPIAKSADRLKKVLKLAKAKDVTRLVNACDAGREGELIFRNIIRFGKLKKPIARLWMQSMTDDSILEAWNSLKTDEEMQHLADAAVCRSESDWLVGLNSTRALTVLQSGAGGFNVTPAGRVQTPTLAILAARQKEILAFTPEPYSEVHATFAAKGGSYEGRWFNPAWKKDEKQPQHTRERIWDAAEAAAIAARCEGCPASVTETKKPVSMPAPLLFDLTSLQKEASNRFGFSARRTLQIAQECYEKHKVLTYPRTDSKFLPNDYLKVATRTVSELGAALPEFAPFTAEILEQRRIRPNKRVFDSSKVSDHFAIIPTGRIVPLTGDTAKIYTLVVQRFLGVFLPNAEFEDTERTTTVESKGARDHFYTHGRVQLSAGWRALYGAERKKKDELCAVAAGEKVKAKEVHAMAEQTKAPSAYTEATLLTAMETAGKLVEDDDLADAMKERGLGTPATRAAIIEGLITQEYIAREGKELMATRRGMDLIDLLGKIGLSTLSSPELTGEWEYRLKQMENGKLGREHFMQDIRRYTTEIVDSVRDYMKDGSDNPDLDVTCPSCGSHPLSSRLDAVSCKHCKFRLRRVHAGLSLSDELLAQLIREKQIPVMDGFRSKFGKPFKAGLRMVAPATERASWKAEFYFEDDKKESAESAMQPAGLIAVKGCGELPLFVSDKQWSIPDMEFAGGHKGFSVSRMILGREVTRELLAQVLATGKSELLSGFVSQRTHRAFDAYLVLDEKKGNVGFEFPPREEKPKSARSAKAADKKFTRADAAQEDLSAAKRHGVIKVKGKGEHELLETENAWHVDGVAYGKNRKPLTIPHVMCDIRLTAEVVVKLLTKGKTDLIKDFVSHKSGKKFDAYLVFTPASGRISYEFPPRGES
ncbi:MAG: DNA topoisomerase 3 [Akkermansia sp.]|nr:DNA topoisomerase 3 [Akkermansia sp.]